MLTHRQFSVVVIGVALLILTACDPVTNPNNSDKTFNDAISLAGHSFDILDSNTGLAVDVRWDATDVLANDNLVTFAVVFNEVDETNPIMEDAIDVTLPAIGNEVSVTYMLSADVTVLPQGVYTVNLGWYYDSEPVQYLMTNFGTTEQEQYLRLFDFSVDAEGNISPNALTIDSSDS